jgi:hypothetical protein
MVGAAEESVNTGVSWASQATNLGPGVEDFDGKPTADTVVGQTSQAGRNPAKQGQEPNHPRQKLSASQDPIGYLRSLIITLAIQEALAGPFGAVSDNDVEWDPVEKRFVRKGWKRLLAYFQEVLIDPLDWNNKAWLDLLKTPGKKLADWCGILATWILKRAGLPARWKLQKGLQGLGSPVYDLRNPGIRPGDVCVIRRAWHHFVVVKADYARGLIVTVEGNASIKKPSDQNIVMRVRKMSEVLCYYPLSRKGGGEPREYPTGG